jgi:hypothetical protein
MHCICPGPQFTQRKTEVGLCIWHKICSITRMQISAYLQQQRRHVQSNIQDWICGAVNTLCTWGTSVHIAKARGSAVYLTPRMQYNAHWIVEIPPIAGELPTVEYEGLNMRSCKYFVYGRDHSSHSINWRMCAVFGNKFAVKRALNCRDMYNCSADAYSWILKPKYAVLKILCI